MAPSSLRPTSPHPNCSGAICPAGLTAQSHGCRRHPSTNLLKSIYAYAHAADPVYSLRRNPLRHLTFETSFSRFYKVPIPWTQRHPRDPTPTPTPQGTQGDPRARGGGGARGTQGRLRRPWGGWAHGTLWGYSGAIPNGKPFRVESFRKFFKES